MGQAKLRGTREERVAQAKGRKKGGMTRAELRRALLQAFTRARPATYAPVWREDRR
jgi:hypothetical protein